MTVRFGTGPRIGMPHGPRKVERCHKRYTFTHARRQVPALQFIKSLSCASSFYFVTLTLTDAWQDEAARVIQRTRANRPAPAMVVPRHANGDVMDR